MSDEELDKIFKQASDGFNPASDPSGWKDIASKLDREDKIVWYKSKTVHAILILVLVVGTTTLWYSGNLNLNSSDLPDKSREVSEYAIPQSSQDDKDKLKRSTQPEPLSAALSGTPDLPVKNNLQNPPIHSEPVSSEIKMVSNTGETIIKRETQVKDFPDSNESNPINTNDQQGTLPIASVTESDTTLIQATEDTESEMQRESSNSEAPEKDDPSKSRGFSFKASVGPDFSSTELSDQGKPGINFGITTGYIFNSRWSVYTGIIASRKIYSSTNIEKPYNTSGGYAYKVNQLDGDCRILDIPINVYYSFSQRSSLSFKAGVGFSSYIMLEEDYTYIVDKSYGSSEYYQHVEKENNEWFKMMNISILMQKRLNNHLYLEIEPYLKIPLAGIGEGEIPLYSIGSFVSVRYDFYNK